MSSFTNVRIQNKRDTAARWENNNPVLLNGELIIVDTNAGDIRFKIGNGSKTYTQLPFQDEGLYSVLSGKQDELVYDSVPTEGSSNIVNSGDLFNYMNLMFGDIDCGFFTDTTTDLAAIDCGTF